uniref:ATP phosphoribosyltransferase n=1 Tax=Agathobacter sp. TaxID=2021311 RepID=UPI004055D7E7
MNNLFLNFNEKIIFTLRTLYRECGYTPYKMSKFEEYDFYARNKDFLISDNVITFTDTTGKLMALKPDVTLSIIKNIKEQPGEVQKVFYNENVYRISEGNGAFKELMQMGLECFGDIDTENICEVITLAGKSLKSISSASVLELSHLGLLTDIIDEFAISPGDKATIFKYISGKNMHELLAFCNTLSIPSEKTECLKTILTSGGTAQNTLAALSVILENNIKSDALAQLQSIIQSLDADIADMLRIDFSVVSDINYYNGIVFKGFIEGIPFSVLSGGQYDKLMQKMHRKSGAIGFAVYLDVLERLNHAGFENFDKKSTTDINNFIGESSRNLKKDSAKEGGNKTASSCELSKEAPMLNIALPKGRLGEKVYDMFEKAGFECPSIKENSRKLIFENKEKGVRYFWVKPSDVAIYVERGAADIGVAGKDILLEYEPDVYELSDLDIGKCRMAVAAKKDFMDDTQRTLQVATKFTNIARQYYRSKGREIDIIHLNGSIEIAPILGLSDVIVDIVETGTTLKENNLEVIETIVPISARLIANKARYKFKSKQIETIVEKIQSMEIKK